MSGTFQIGTFTAFAPTATAPFQFQATFTDSVLGTAAYNVTTKWNTFGQRWFIEVTDQNGDLILSTALVASPSTYPISMIGGYFSGSVLLFLEESGNFLVSP